MNDQLLLDTLNRLEDKVDDVAHDVKQIQIEQAEMRGIKRAVVYIATSVGTAGGAIAGLMGHRLSLW